MSNKFLIGFILFFSHGCNAADENNNMFIRFNQIGFLSDQIKTAVIISEYPLKSDKFFIKESISNKTLWEGKIPENYFSWGNFNYCAEIDFTDFNSIGNFYLEINKNKSYTFTIDNDIFNSVRDSLSLFFQVQRCGPTNPLLHAPCHLSDVAKVIGYKDTLSVDVTGGWHDAGDYIKFFSTAAYTTYLLLFSYEFDRNKFDYDLNDNQVPDILEEARVGIDWLLRCRFRENLFITQVQDISDHSVGWRLPEHDTLRFNRPGYAGIGKNQIGMFSAVMALASRIWKDRFYDYQFSERLLNSAIEVYRFLEYVPDVDSTQSGFYQDYEHWGKASLGAIELFLSTKEVNYFKDAVLFADSAKSDFWWSWGNINSLAHYKIAGFDKHYLSFIQNNLEHYRNNSNQSSFKEAAQYTWGTTNAFLGAAFQAILFKELTDEPTYDSLIVFQCDYVLGRNPWGVSFIYNLGTQFSKNLHSQIGYFNDGYLPGALSSGPVPASLKENYKINITDTSYSKFNTDSVKYFDDMNNYLTNEPTIGSNATALFVFGYLCTPE